MDSIIYDSRTGEVEFYVNKLCTYVCDKYLYAPIYDIDKYNFIGVVYYDGCEKDDDDKHYVLDMCNEYLITYNRKYNMLSIDYNYHNLDIEFDYTENNLEYINII